VEEAGERLRGVGARVIPLDVSAPFHCPLMAPARDRLAPALADAPIQDFRIPVVSNVSGRPYGTAAEAREVLRDQVCAPVRWVDCVRTLTRGGVRVQLEVGPGTVLTALAPRIDKGLLRPHVSNVNQLEPALARITEKLA
jgi:[acyl-carrier-protein] S-malonyltransferase